MTDRGRRKTMPAFLSACAIVMALAAAGCSEEPTELNALTASLPHGDVVVRDTVITATGSSTYRQFEVMDGAINLLGKTGNYTALTAMNFYPSLFPARDTALIHSARLKLRCITWHGDSTGTFAFSVHRILKVWSQTTLIWDSAQTGFYESASQGSSLTGAGPDTQVVTVSLDTAFVREWFMTPTSTDTRYGFVLVPDPSCTIVRGFTAFDSDSTHLQPQLEIIAGSPTGPSRDTATYYQGIDTFVGNIDNLTTDPQLLYLHAGVGYRASMQFDVSFIPRGAVVNSAELLLQRDPVTSRVSKFTADTAIVAQTIYTSAQPPVLDIVTQDGRRKAGTAFTFSTDVRRSVQLWVHGPNYGLALRPSLEFEFVAPDLLTFYNERASDPLRRPMLKIIYSTPL
ncbi:MAG: DNRLRE domain-containing protein [Bacteroidota bacterium]